MQVQQVSFQGNNPKRGVRTIGQLMNRLYESACREGLDSDMIQISSKMKDGVEVTGTAIFDSGRFVDFILPYKHVHYKNELCTKIMNKFNNVVTKGKAGK